MTVTQLHILYKKPGIDAKQFKHHYETYHAPLVRELVVSPDDRPLLYKRHYIIKEDEAAPLVDYDAVTSLIFRDQDQADRFMKILTTGEAAERVARDSALFLDMTRATILNVETAENNA